MQPEGLTLFDTRVGRCGIAWGPRGILGVQLPELRDDDTRARVLRHCPDAQDALPPPDVQRAIEAVVALLGGEARDLARDLNDIVLDMDRVLSFDRRVYEVARTIPPGDTLSYGEIATRLGDRGLARAVGQALGRNPFAIVVPCHRVVAAGGKVGGFSANGGSATKKRILAIERGQAPLWTTV